MMCNFNRQLVFVPEELVPDLQTRLSSPNTYQESAAGGLSPGDQGLAGGSNG